MNKKIIMLLSGLMTIASVMLSCRNEEKPPASSIEKIQFEVSKKEMMVGENATIKLTVTPPSARESKKVEYSASARGIVEIDNENSSNEGIVFEALNPGNVVIMAKVNGLVDYCEITVEGNNETAIPYISVTDSVLEIKVGSKRHVVASLQGGIPGDLSNFTFVTDGNDAVMMEYANNTAVIEGIKTGSARITAIHPKAQYSVDVLAFVLNEGETAKYITGENVIFMNLGDAPLNYRVRLVGLEENQINYCIYQAVEGSGAITVNGSGDSCTIEAKKPGVAKVRVSNQAVEYPFEFQVVVRNPADAVYVSALSNFYIIDSAEFKSVGVRMAGDVPDDFMNYYTYSLSAEGIVSVAQAQGNFMVNGLKNGIVVMTINNKYSDFPCEILIVVQNQEANASSNEIYIRTSQQVIQMEVGGPDAILKMELVGGNEADKNNFEWEVEDSGIITAAAPGVVRYARAMVQSNSVEAEAIITAKKIGTTKIRVFNPKALNEATVMVKVYPKGTFNGSAIYLSGPGIVRVQEGKSVNVYTPVIGGDERLLGTTVWQSADSSIADVNGSSVYGNVRGVLSGVTRLKVSGDNIAQEYEAVVVVYKEGEEDIIPYAYTDSVYYRITVGQTVQIPVRHPNSADSDFSFTVINSNKNSIYHIVSNDVIIVNGREEGSGELVITTADSKCNNLTVYIIVEPQEIDVNRPYMLTGDNFAGTDEGGVVSYTVTLAGANAGKLNGITWSIDDERVARVKGRTGNAAEIEGIGKGQTVLRINHSESMNEKAVVVYVVEKGQAVEGKIVIGIEQTNYVMSVNQSLFLRLLTNATETQKLGFIWKTDNEQKVYVEDNYDTAVITAREAGNAKVTVYEKDNKHVIDLDIFITIKDMEVIKGEVGFPDSVILVKNQNKIIKGNVIGVTASSVDDIDYTLMDQGIASVAGNGLEVTMKGLEAGQTFLTVTSFKMDYYKKIVVICVENESDLDNLYYYTVDKMLYRIKKNDEIKVNLVFGANGFPENEKRLIEWHNSSNNGAVLIAANGDGASIIGKNEGQAVIQIKSRLMAKPVEIVVEVSEAVKGSDYYRFVYSPIQQMSKDAVNMVPISIYYGNEYYDEYDAYKPGIKMETGYSGIVVANSDNSVAEAAMAGQNLRITAKQAGQTQITLSHGLIGEDARLLIVVYDGAVPPLSSELVIFIPKTHWLIPQGQTKTVTLQTNADSLAGNSNITWNNHNQDLFSVNASDKTNVQVAGIKEGSGTITIEYGGKVIDTIYVSVASDNQVSTVSVATESIIILSMDEAEAGGYTTRIIVNGGSENGIMWNIADSSIADISEGGMRCTLWPIQSGITELTVRGSGFNKTIMVKVVNTEAEKLSSRLMNLDQRYYKIKKGETCILNPYYKMARPSYPVSATAVYDNRVIQFQQSGGSIAVTGKNIGIEHLRLYNGQCENAIEVVFEVDEAVSGSIAEVKNMVYMTTDTPAIIIAPGTVDYYVRVNVIGEYKGNEHDFQWNGGNNKITVQPFGFYALVSANSNEGSAEITVSNNLCDGLPLTIKVVIGSAVNYTENNTPYIYASKNVYTMNKGDSSLTIPLEIRGISAVNWNNAMISYTGSAVNCTLFNGNIIVTEKDYGTSTITVTYQGINHSLILYVIVQDSGGSGTAYLTTGQNYVIINEYDTRVVDIALVNYTEPDSSKFTWKSDNTAIAHVIGNGRTVQILGMGVGVTKVTVNHPQAYNTLDIIVKIIPAGSTENICYLTTSENVIETYISTMTSQVMVSKVGGKISALEATWSVDDPTVVGVIGNNNVGYYTAKKAGVAKITVTDKEAGSVSIVVIVRKSKPGDQYLTTGEPIKQITPGSTNNVITVQLAGGEENDEKDFRWEIFTQLPSSVDVARQGGSVISIYAMGSRATVNGIYAGTARVKVTHPKAAEALFILVQVTHFQSMRFTQQKVDMEIEDMMYVTLETPDYENYTGKVKYMTDNPAVCTVYGSSKAVLLSTHMAGKATVTAFVEGADLMASVDVNVVPEKNYDQPYIITSKTMYVLSPREMPFIIDAQMVGVGVTEADWDDLLWKVNYNNPAMISIYPQNYTVNNVIQTGFSKGRMIQVEVMNREYPETENCTIEISCPSLTSRVKTIFLQVQEDSNAFTITKERINMQSNELVELSCNIIGGSSKDYQEVYWMADKDSFDPTQDIVKIMGSGKSVNLLAVKDGVTQVTAVYRGLTKICSVTVKSSVYFNISMQNYLTYPGARAADNGWIEIEYEVRPVTAFIQWIDTDQDFKHLIADKQYTQAENRDGTGVGKILLNPIQEGSFTIMGISNNKSSKVNIVVKNIYRFVLNRHSIGPIVPYNAAKPADQQRPDYSKAAATVGYTVSPGNVKIKPKSHTEEQLFNLGITLEIDPINYNPDTLRGTGNIYVKCTKETLQPLNIVLQILKPDGNPSGLEQTLTVTCRYPPGEGRLVPVFERVYGKWSNRNEPAYVKSSTIQVNPTNNQLTGQLYNGQRIPTASLASSTNTTFNDYYDLVIGDGEEHYILLDKINKDAHFEIIDMDDFHGSETLGAANNADTRNVSASMIAKEDASSPSGGKETLIKISGGSDYIVYSNFSSDYDLWVGLSSDFPYVGKTVTKERYCSPTPTKIENFDRLKNIATLVNGTRHIAQYTNSQSQGYFINDYSFLDSLTDWPSETMGTSALKDRFYNETIYYFSPQNNCISYSSEVGIIKMIPPKVRIGTDSHDPTTAYVTTYILSAANNASNFKIVETYTPYGSVSATEYNPIRNSYRNGDIRLNMLTGKGNTSNADSAQAYLLVKPKTLDEYWKPYPAYGDYNFDAFLGFAGTGKRYLRNYITKKYLIWDKDKNPLVDTPADNNWNGKLYCLDWMSDVGSGYTNRTGETYIQFEKGYYKENNGGLWSVKRSALYEAPLGFTLQYTGLKEEIRISMIDVFNERYDKNNVRTLHDQYSEVSKNSANTYRYYPMPSTNVSVISIGSLSNYTNGIFMGTITIKYKNAYGDNNNITINVYQEIRQCHANYDGYNGGTQYRLAQSWDDLTDKGLDEIFKINNGPKTVIEPDNSKDNVTGKIKIDASY